MCDGRVALYMVLGFYGNPMSREVFEEPDLTGYR